ncbi:hypothetical protein [Streptomyces sp. PRh5]|nr:hypothetical protein [Streptomyces sp. PRh5]
MAMCPSGRTRTHSPPVAAYARRAWPPVSDPLDGLAQAFFERDRR